MDPWKEFYEVRPTSPGNAEVIDRESGKVVAHGDAGFMAFHARTLWESRLARGDIKIVQTSRARPKG